MADPTPPLPTTKARLPAGTKPLRLSPSTKPRPSNWSPNKLPSGRTNKALQAPATWAVGEASSTKDMVVTLWGMVIRAPFKLVNLRMLAKAAT